METSQIVSSMFKMRELTAADIKAICNARGFSLVDAGTPALLENFLLSDIGLEAVFSGLERKEIIMLHYLKCMKKPVDITPFERLTGKRSNWYSTFNQRYGDVFKTIKTRLIRKGVLAFSTNPNLFDKKTKLEKLIFGFPVEFHSHLPALFVSPAVLPGPGEFNDAFVRKKLNELLNPGSGPGPGEKTGNLELGLNRGVLQMGESQFRLDSFQKWQHWQWSLCSKPSLDYAESGGNHLSPMVALKYAFSLPGPDEWIEPDELKMILKMFCKEKSKLDVHEICGHGWKTGCLVRRKKEGKTCYRQADAYLEIPNESRHADYLHTDDTGNFIVDLNQIPLKCLETVSRISLFRIEDGRLTASPDITRTGRILHEIRDDPLIFWLAQTSGAFDKTLQTVTKRFGRHLVHRNLLIAKVKNVGLKVTLEKTFKDGKIIFLPGDYIAFPEKLIDQVENLVTKNGFAVKLANDIHGRRKTDE